MFILLLEASPPPDSPGAMPTISPEPGSASLVRWFISRLRDVEYNGSRGWKTFKADKMEGIKEPRHCNDGVMMMTCLHR